MQQLPQRPFYSDCALTLPMQQTSFFVKRKMQIENFGWSVSLAITISSSNYCIKLSVATFLKNTEQRLFQAEQNRELAS